MNKLEKKIRHWMVDNEIKTIKDMAIFLDMDNQSLSKLLAGETKISKRHFGRFPIELLDLILNRFKRQQHEELKFIQEIIKNRTKGKDVILL